MDSALHEKAKQIFQQRLELTERTGINDLLHYLFNQTDFLKAPASSKYHDAEPGGLLVHSAKTYMHLIEILQTSDFFQNVSIESAAIAGLLHDVCKINTYKQEIKHRKIMDPGGRSHWEDYTGYEIEDSLPAGHGEKSVMIIERFIELTPEEIMAINWHRGGFDSRVRSFEGSRQISEGMQKYPLIIALHAADLMATYAGETRS